MPSSSRSVLTLSVCLFLVLLTGCGGSSSSGNPSNPPGNGGGQTGSDIRAVNHVLAMMQENRSFDSYFWAMTDYRRRNNIPINSSDGKIKDGSDPDAAKMATNNISPATGQAIAPYHTGSICTEDLTPDWAESHKQMNLENPAAAGPGSPMNGFVTVAYGLSQFYQVLADKDGHRAMGYFDENDLNYYYFVASQFAMADMFFSPVATRTSANRMYFHAGTSQGLVHPDSSTITQLNAKTIWRALDEKGVSWKIYVSDWGINNWTFFNFFTDSNDLARRAKIVPIDEYFSDVANGTLPAVAFIETGMSTGRDEHPTNNPGVGVPVPPEQAIRVQSGAAWTARIINALMNSPSWKDSVFFWTFDEGGGAFDHVPPISVVNPDGIKPRDLDPVKDCFGQPCSNFDFNITGFRVPNFIVSPFAKKHYVSHTPMDFTAILKFIETRWEIPPLTERDRSMPDMTEFFDFRNPPWATPPTPPAQKVNGICDFTKQ
ncbi:MAG TPA: alkaline phosphatase family protein [Terriglobales bacterium]|nr:alkaline phosphatase family protein [Terriglobales bacterium]